jgi:large subunit ribosomal protein L4e
VKGRRAHPPKADKKITREMNNKEWLIALKSGLLASLNKDLIADNGQKVPTQYPVVLDEKVEIALSKTKDVVAFLTSAGLSDELARLAVKTIRAGKGTMRGRMYKIKRGPLFVLSSDETPLFKALRNVQGIDVISADMLMVSDFGMAEKPGRMVVFTQPALEQFMEVFN